MGAWLFCTASFLIRRIAKRPRVLTLAVSPASIGLLVFPAGCMRIPMLSIWVMSNASPPWERLKEVIEFRNSLAPETDRGCALMAAAYLDAQLERLLRAFFIRDDSIADELPGQSKPLGSFSSRIDIAYALGLIGTRTRRDLHLIRRVRNDFGHKPEPISFSDAAIANRCRELYYDLSDEASPRNRFVRVVLGVLAHVHGALSLTKHASPCPDIKITANDRRAFQIVNLIAQKRSKPSR